MSTQHKLTVVSANLVKKSARSRHCAWCEKPVIKQGFAYYRVVLKNGKFQCDSICLNCWVTR